MTSYIKPNVKEISIHKSKINQKFNNQKDQTCCTLCKREIKNVSGSFHKSHTVPFFCLENIKALYKKNYGVLTANYIGLRIQFGDKEFVGTNKAGVFYSICSKCDQEKFNVYESENALLYSNPADLVDSIALKIYLNELFNSRFRNFKAKLNHSELTEDQLISSYYESVGKIESSTVEVDIQDFLNDLQYAKKSYENGYRNFRILYHRVLDYTVPIAAQTSIPIARNIDYSILQSVTIQNKNRLEDLVVCIFPLKEKSVILMFTRIDNKLMKQYNKQFKKLSDDEKLKEIFYLLIRYKGANYFCSPLIKDTLMDENIRGVYSIEDTVMVLNKHKIDLANFEDYSWKKNLPSLLSEKYSMQALMSDK